MEKHEMLRLKDPFVTPTSEILEQTLGNSYAAYESFQEGLPTLDMSSTTGSCLIAFIIKQYEDFIQVFVQIDQFPIAFP